MHKNKAVKCDCYDKSSNTLHRKFYFERREGDKMVSGEVEKIGQAAELKK